MKVHYRTESDAAWKEISLAEALSRLEGYWATSTVMPRLERGEILYDQVGEFKLVSQQGLAGVPEDPLQREISRLLDRISVETHPMVYRLLKNDPESLRDSVYQQCLDDNITPAVAIASLEQTFAGL